MTAKKRLNYDIILGAALAVCVSVIACIFLGFAKYGVATPFSYGGGDDFTGLVSTKLIGETGWFWYNDKIGAPFGSSSFDFSANMLMNFDMAVIWVLSLFIKDAVIVNNIRYILVFPMCAVSAFYAMRKLKTNRVLASFGAVIYSLTPYIFYRNVNHFSLAACYFVPISVLLCVWCCEKDDAYFVFGKEFFKNRKNLLSVLFCLLIANNGIGYYAFFTCFFLCVSAICNLFTEKKLRSVLAPLANICLIVVFSALALAPSLIYSLKNGANASAVLRNTADGEIYSLKIAQLFMPLSGHGIEKLQSVIDRYNSSMPLVNENQGAYLGIAGIAGFIICLALLLKKDSKEGERSLFVLTRMNICAVLFATVGGFCSLMSLFFHMLRGFNRISIFIMFISIVVLCLGLQEFYRSIVSKRSRKVKIIALSAVLVFGAVSVAELIPEYGSHDNDFEYYNSQYQSDKNFVQHIEEVMGENAMIFQLPYHATPEAGSQNNMNDYHLYAGYISSKSLYWSYGGTKGREGDAWNRNVASLPADIMIHTICEAGFTGLYIDNRAYTPEQLSSLHEQLGNILDVDFTTSENGNLSFADMRDYISRNEIIKNPEVLKAFDNTEVFGHDQLYYLGESTADINMTTIAPGTIQYGPYTTLDAASYTVKIYGDNLTAADFDVTYNGGTEKVDITVVSEEASEVVYTFDTHGIGNISAVEFRTLNNSEEFIGISYIEVFSS